jgi:hypothetical protein
VYPHEWAALFLSQFERILAIGRRSLRIVKHVFGETAVIVGVPKVGLQADGFVEIG